MKKFFIASLVGAIIVYVWSALSWIVLPIHTHSFHYTPKQDTIMSVLNKSSLGNDMYMLPNADNRNAGMFDSKYMKAQQENHEKAMGKPFAMLIYNNSFDMPPIQMVIGIIIDLLAVMCATIILVMAKDKLVTFFMRWWVVMVIGFIVALNSYMLEWNWMGFPWHFVKGEIIDTFMEWGLCGAWLSWYLGRK